MEDEKDQIKIGQPKTTAAGLPAIFHTMKHTLKEMGAIRGTKTLLQVNQKNGFDCPGCAWPDPSGHRSMAEFCENGAKAVADEATLKRVTADFFRQYSITQLKEKSDFWLGQQGRLTCPMWKKPGSDYYEEITWNEAIGTIATELQALRSPHESVFYTSGRTSNEAAFLYQLFVRKFGTNNLPDCSNMCHESSGVALNKVMGIGKGSVSLEDFEHADLIILIGQNPGTNHPRMLASLQKAKRRGCKIISINPLPEAGLMGFSHPQEIQGLLGRSTALTDLFLQVKINGDIAVLKGLMKVILEEETKHPGEILDHDFIKNYSVGVEAFLEDLEQVSWQEILTSSGVTEAKIREAASLYIKAKSTLCCWAMGVTQHKNAVGNIQEIVNLLLLKGNLGRPGAGVCPVRGHSNVQGDRTMGICEKPTKTFLQNLEKEFHFTPPKEHGYDVVATIKAMAENKVKVFIGMGGNFIAASPDTFYTCDAIKKCRLTVQISTKLNRSHVETGESALILPCLGRTEVDLQASGKQFVTVENSMGIVHSSIGRLVPASPLLKSEVSIVALLASQTLNDSSFDWKKIDSNYDVIRDHISRAIPGFENFNARVRSAAGMTLYHSVRDELKFSTPTQKAHFTVNTLPQWSLKQGEYLMMTIRSHDQYNTTIYGLDDRYRGIYGGRKIVLINPKDMEAASLKEGDLVKLVSRYGGQERMVKDFRLVAYDIPCGCIATYFPEANALIAVDDHADFSHTPASKSIVVSFFA